jgi:LlaJI restriction endonuclease.
MRIFFEKYLYKTDLIKRILGENLVHEDSVKGTWETDRIGYIFVNTDEYSGPVFILPKSFLINEGCRLNILGMNGIYPEDVLDTDAPANPLEIEGRGSFLPELGLWLYRALKRFREEHEGSPISQRAMLESQLSDNNSRDKDFLSTALDLMDFFKGHRNLFTQINIISHSGRDKIDWPKTIKGDPFIEDGEPWYFDPASKEKTIDIDDTLLVLFYSVLKYLHDKYRFPIDLGNVPYELLPVNEVQRLIDTGVGSKQMRRIRHKYFRDDLKRLWGLLDSFFTYNFSDEDRNRTNEHLLVRKFESIFEVMVDSLISDASGVEDLKKQDDGKLVDHIFRYPSLVGNISDIYFIGDSKYYRDDKRPEGVALYKQFTYAKNAIQYHIDKYYLANKRGHFPPKGRGEIRYRDTLTEGYNITPNFFIRARVTENDTDFSSPSLKKTFWDEEKRQENPPSNKHFEDRLFDRDTLILREFSINLLFVIASYAGYEEECWSSGLHRAIRDTFIEASTRNTSLHAHAQEREYPWI